MTAPRHPPREIDGKSRTVHELLAGRKYSIDYYQREYKWQKKHVAELIDDLASKFLESHQESNEHDAVAEYGHYFLGSIIVSDKDGQNSIIDGQQRLTTLTMLLIFVRKHYLNQKLVARSLHERAYDRNPGFRRFIEPSGLPFHAHPKFKKVNLDARQDLHRRLAERIWDPERLATDALS